MSYNTPYEITENMETIAVKKHETKTIKFIFMAILGGAYIGLGSIFALKVTGELPQLAQSNPGLVSLIFGLLFPLGFLLVTLAGGELFTSTVAVTTTGLFGKKYRIKDLLKIWGISYLGNFIGIFLTAMIFGKLVHTLDSENIQTFLASIAHKKTSASFLITLIKGIGANWLVCLAAVVGFSAKDATGKILAIWVPVTAFVVMGFEHSIANMFFIPLSMVQGADISMYDFLIKNLLPATIGNILGGALFVGLPYSFIFKKKAA
ncbi:MAG: formate/nitrite transporter family protein [Spirochaetales bacterium]|nr:formate/nitrite transporter family protein [Spirochaetales bacterium]